VSNKNKHRDGVVYSTNPDFQYANRQVNENATVSQKQQMLKVRRDSKMRAGKTVTLVEDFVGKESDLEDLGKLLKSKCGTGGTVKDRVILIQGDFVERVQQILADLGYKTKRVGG
jgi:translation initiation factor 1